MSSSVNAINPNVDLTVRLYDSFYNYDVNVEANEYDVVNSYFKSVFANNQIAQNFTVTLFRIAEETQTPVLTLLNEIQGQSAIELTSTLAYYLNGLRSPSTLLGINSAVTPNYWTARNVML
jgi:pyruvate/2-oxoacid:ferredoxin oxidoreductase alpha subunit